MSLQNHEHNEAKLFEVAYKFFLILCNIYKGQLILKCLFGVTVSTKNQQIFF